VSESSISVLRMTSQAAGAFRRTQIERSDQRVAWKRTDQAFFAAGACHVLAWVCREAFPARSIGIAAVRFESEQQVFHTYATWNGWAFDHSGWNPEPELLAVNTDFEGRPLERIEITVGFADFCEQHCHRMPNQYWRDSLPRAREYVARYSAPWV
jgi:hypothetical protein